MIVVAFTRFQSTFQQVSSFEVRFKSEYTGPTTEYTLRNSNRNVRKPGGLCKGHSVAYQLDRPLCSPCRRGRQCANCLCVVCTSDHTPYLDGVGLRHFLDLALCRLSRAGVDSGL